MIYDGALAADGVMHTQMDLVPCDRSPDYSLDCDRTHESW